MAKNPNRPKIKYKHVKKPPPVKPTKEEVAAKNLKKLERRFALTPTLVTQLIFKQRGLLTQVCRSLRIPRDTLNKYIEKHPECVDALAHARDAMGDVAEAELYKKTKEGDVRCILFYLSTVQGHRGYKQAGGGAVGADGTDGRNGPVFVETINIVGVPSGTFLPRDTDTSTVIDQ